MLFYSVFFFHSISICNLYCSTFYVCILYTFILSIFCPIFLRCCSILSAKSSSHFQFQNILHYMALYDHYLHVPAPNQFRHLGLYQPLHLSTLQDLLHLVHFPNLNYIHKQSQNLLRLQRLQSLNTKIGSNSPCP